MSSRLVISLQYLLPKQAITTLAGKFANAKAGRLTTAVISWFIRRYGVNMTEAAQPDIQQYQTFNDFFTRSLRVGVRSMAKAEFVCPADGAVSQFGAIEADQIFQAKGHAYSTSAIVGGDQELAKYFENGSFATLYLSPKDYHRVHMPCDGHLKRMIYVPGALFSVNPATAENIPGLFARNERVICEFQSEFGLFVLVLVGATIVGSIATTWHGVVNSPRSKSIQEWRYDEPIQLNKGQEFGRFLLGSTVIILLPKQELEFNPDWAAGQSVRLGEILAKRQTA